MKIAGRLFHTYQAGMALYALSQSFFMSAVFSLCLCRMKARRAPRWLCVASWTFWILNPYLTVFSFVTTKDVLFGAFSCWHLIRHVVWRRIRSIFGGNVPEERGFG